MLTPVLSGSISLYVFSASYWEQEKQYQSTGMDIGSTHTQHGHNAHACNDVILVLFKTHLLVPVMIQLCCLMTFSRYVHTCTM